MFKNRFFVIFQILDHRGCLKLYDLYFLSIVVYAELDSYILNVFRVLVFFEFERRKFLKINNLLYFFYFERVAIGFSTYTVVVL